MSDTHPAPGPAGQTTHAAEPKEIGGRQKQYMIGRRRIDGIVPMAAGPNLFNPQKLAKRFDELPDYELVRVVESESQDVDLMGTSTTSSDDIVVVRTSSAARVADIEAMRQRDPTLIVERDHLLEHLGSFQPQFVRPSNVSIQAARAPISVRFHVQDSDGHGIANATVIVYGQFGNEDKGETDNQGDVTINVYGGYLNMTAALYIKPAANYWEHFVERPELDASGVNTITLQPLASYGAARYASPAANGPAFIGWGQRAMGILGLDPQRQTGVGVRVAIIDSGCDTNHPALSHISIGRDYTNQHDRNQPDTSSWREDQIFHGTHCAGIIAGNGRDGHIRGFAPQAEMHILKVFPGGAFNNLTAAINYCIANRIHVVNCSLGGSLRSELVEQAIQRARQAGVAMFVAAGNSGTSVQFPAVVPGVLCVSAIGQAGMFPGDTYHARTIPDGANVSNGQVFPARFTCHGPEVSVCGPGVGIISSVPGGGYAAWDGTSMADPHLTGLGALLAAHHPALRNEKARNAAWVDRLFGLIIDAAQFVGMPRDYAGAGLPSSPTALGISTAQQPSPASDTRQFSSDAIRDLIQAIRDTLPSEARAPRGPNA
ncbi:serine protease [Tardiphaga alba]|uniref:Serine protease n=1 Tax=Tardiphaga alba TaxID=340268 RepID=A0ABX8A3Y7_9BRAD|nr:S8 family serine peptidase [Tardiphaga alba]QUS38202.1 serine protease [Tardiphaga alba]